MQYAALLFRTVKPVRPDLLPSFNPFLGQLTHTQREDHAYHTVLVRTLAKLPVADPRRKVL